MKDEQGQSENEKYHSPSLNTEEFGTTDPPIGTRMYIEFLYGEFKRTATVRYDGRIRWHDGTWKPAFVPDPPEQFGVPIGSIGPFKIIKILGDTSEH